MCPSAHDGEDIVRKNVSKNWCMLQKNEKVNRKKKQNRSEDTVITYRKEEVRGVRAITNGEIPSA
jgi:hypothetical protein